MKYTGGAVVSSPTKTAVNPELGGMTEEYKMGQRKRHGDSLSDSHTLQNPKPMETEPVIWKFRLYIAGDSPHSIQALSNLEAMCREYLNGQCEIEIIDLLREPQQYLKDDILVTPTLVRYVPGPVCTLIGNLSNRQEVLRALGLKETWNGS